MSTARYVTTAELRRRRERVYERAHAALNDALDRRERTASLWVGAWVEDLREVDWLLGVGKEDTDA